MLRRMWLNEYRANMLKEYRKMLKEAMMARLLRLRSLKEVTIDVDDHDESLCSICTENMEIGTVAVSLPCSHKFHKT
ncbi:unnamed protein product [Dovyalis caffra]|uniref:RING-type domain-containing protein n=1 Tax=Dovyalis caffra TaxID=77055 RepID=A0AAV1SDM5_9ROSI|nr:unnamed protein product [Dovyalis caffra]